MSAQLETLQQEVETLQKENEHLKLLLANRNKRPTAYETVSAAAKERVNTLYPNTNPYGDRTTKRRLMADLKWNLRIRTITDITQDDVERCLEYIGSWVE